MTSEDEATDRELAWRVSQMGMPSFDVVSAQAAKPPTKPIWASDKKCSICGIRCQMGRFVSDHRSKHHCRSCGSVVCGSHSSRRRALPFYGYKDPVRVCDTCADDLGDDETVKSGAGGLTRDGSIELDTDRAMEEDSTLRRRSRGGEGGGKVAMDTLGALPSDTPPKALTKKSSWSLKGKRTAKQPSMARFQSLQRQGSMDLRTYQRAGGSVWGGKTGRSASDGVDGATTDGVGIQMSRGVEGVDGDASAGADDGDESTSLRLFNMIGSFLFNDLWWTTWANLGHVGGKSAVVAAQGILGFGGWAIDLSERWGRLLPPLLNFLNGSMHGRAFFELTAAGNKMATLGYGGHGYGRRGDGMGFGSGGGLFGSDGDTERDRLTELADTSTDRRTIRQSDLNDVVEKKSFGKGGTNIPQTQAPLDTADRGSSKRTQPRFNSVHANGVAVSGSLGTLVVDLRHIYINEKGLKSLSAVPYVRVHLKQSPRFLDTPLQESRSIKKGKVSMEHRGKPAGAGCHHRRTALGLNAAVLSPSSAHSALRSRHAGCRPDPWRHIHLHDAL